MQHVNLIDERLLPTRQLLSGARVIAIGVLGLLLVGGHAVVESQRYAQLNTDAAALAATAAVDGGETDDTAIQAQISRRQALRDLLAKVEQRPFDSAALLRQVVAALPERVWLTEIDVLGTQGLRIAGAAIDSAALNAFAERLGRIESLRGVPIQTLRIEPLKTDADDGATAKPAAAHAFVLASAAYQGPEGDR